MLKQKNINDSKTHYKCIVENFKFILGCKLHSTSMARNYSTRKKHAFTEWGSWLIGHAI